MKSESTTNKKSKIFGMSSYLAMFPPKIVRENVEKFCEKKCVICDPFSGRGTTALVAREMNRKFIGSDLSPYAFVLSKSKIDKYSKKSLLKYLETLEKEYNKWKVLKKNVEKHKKYKELKYYFSSIVLNQLIFLREKLGTNWKSLTKVQNAILAFALGIMHGPTKKDGSTSYFSVSMPNTFSMSPNYVKNYVKKNNLVKPKINIFEKIKKRINNLFESILEKNFSGKIFLHDASKENKKIKNNSIDFVFTSPPYLDLVNYLNSNWLKLWLLGYERKQVNKEIKLSNFSNLDDYANFIKNFLNALYKKLKSNAKVCLVVGNVRGSKTIKEVWKKIKNEVKFKEISCDIDKSYSPKRKTTNILNKNGGAVKNEIILILEKIK